jgi:hypothetical protein
MNLSLWRSVRFTDTLNKLTFNLGPSQIKESDKPGRRGPQEIRQRSNLSVRLDRVAQ